MITKSLRYFLFAFSFGCASVAATAQDNTQTVSGTVVDAATGQPLAGVIVSAYGNQRQTTMTDEQGRYELNVPEQTRSLLMRVDGYNLQQSAIAGGKADARLYRDAFSETYSRQVTAGLSSEATNFGNTSQLSIDPLVSQQLGADMRSVSHGAIPGMGSLMLIQGINSLHTNAQPLVVVDDVIMDMQ